MEVLCSSKAVISGVAGPGDTAVAGERVASAAAQPANLTAINQAGKCALTQPRAQGTGCFKSFYKEGSICTKLHAFSLLSLSCSCCINTQAQVHQVPGLTLHTATVSRHAERDAGQILILCYYNGWRSLGGLLIHILEE